MPKRIAGLLTLVVVFSWAIPAVACSVPVFRYALDHWPRDPYEVVLFHRGEMDSELQTVVRDLGDDGTAAEQYANVRLHTVDLDDDLSESQRLLWQQQNTETVPWMVVKYPLSSHNGADVWAGSPNREVVRQLLASPLRQEIASRLLKGDSAVWVLLEGGDAEKNDAACRLLEKQLAAAQLRLQLPEIDPQDVAQGLIETDSRELKVAFSVVRLSKDDPQESMLAEMLRGLEADLRDPQYAGEPMAFPVFGRGRALYALVGRGINAEMIDESCEFLVGRCECTVKRENPGTDLLTAVDWEGLIDPLIKVDEALPALTGLSPFAQVAGDGDGDSPDRDGESDPAQSDSAPGASAGPARESESPTVSNQEVTTNSVARNVLLVAGIGAAGVVVASLLMVPRKN